MLTQLKERFLPHGMAPRRVALGVNRGLVFDFDWRHDAQRILGLAERELSPWLNRLGREVRTVVDVGSAEGWYVAYFLRHTRADIISFEPTARSDEMLRAVALNNLDASRVRLIPSFVGTGRDGTVALDSFAATLALPALIKVDVEGAEVDVLRGARQLLALSANVSWIIETHSVENERDCISMLQSAGYATRIVRNVWWRAIIPETRPLPHNRWLIAT